MWDDRGHRHVSGVPKRARPIQGEPAGVVSRAAAAVVDTAATVGLLGGLFLTVNAAVLAINPLSYEPVVVPLPVTLIAGVVTSILYLTIAWGSSGRTAGNALFGLRVVDVDSRRRLRVPRALIRAVACTLFPIGLAWVLVSPGRRSLQDRLVGTVVVYRWSSA